MANNRRKGHSWERKIAQILRERIYPEIQTARYASRETDDKGIDFVNTGSIDIQAKNLTTHPNFKEVFDHMDTDKPKALFYKYNRIRGKDGEFVMMPLEDFLIILEDLDA